MPDHVPLRDGLSKRLASVQWVATLTTPTPPVGIFQILTVSRSREGSSVAMRARVSPRPPASITRVGVRTRSVRFTDGRARLHERFRWNRRPAASSAPTDRPNVVPAVAVTDGMHAVAQVTSLM